MKKKIIIGSSILIVLGVSIFLFNFFLKKKAAKEIYFKWNDLKVAVYEEKNLKDLIKKTNTIIKNQKIDTLETGKKKLKFSYNYKKQKYEETVTYKVVDNVAPKIFGSGSKTVNLNYENDLCDLITMADNYDRYLDCVIEGDYDLTKAGTYKIKFIVTDDASNSSNHNLILKVVVPSSGGNNDNPSQKQNLSFSEALNLYGGENKTLGIDVSKWQGDIDFTKVKDAGATFVMMRIGNKTKIGEEINIDPYFLTNIKKAKDAGLKVGVYLYSKASNVGEATNEAKWIINTLNGEKLDLPIAFDWENWSTWNSYHLNFYDLNKMAEVFIKEVEKKGYEGILYGSKFYLENFFTGDFKNIWLAHYTSKTSYENYLMWQFSNIGSIPGINGDVDLDVLKIK